MPVGIVDTVGGDLPLPVGGGVAVGVPPSDVDVLVDRTPLWLSIDANSPYQRETAQYQRDQVDQQPEAGEQSLAGWWTRSQMSFHFGAGLKYLDSTARPAPEDRVRFDTSRNVDCWTPGTLKRLNGTTLSQACLVGETVWTETADNDVIVVATDSKVQTYNGASWTTLSYGSTFPIRAFCIDGANFYAATADGVWSAPITGGTATKLWSLPGDAAMCLGWQKQRLMLGYANKLYVLEGTGPALPTPKMTHPVTSWRWSCFADGPSGIHAGGYAGLTSSMYSIKEEDVSGTPTLGAPICLLTMPPGERILSALYYINSMLILGTNRGIRVSVFNSYYGSVSLGPLAFDPLVAGTGAITALNGYDRFVYGGTILNGEASLIRLDLSAPLDQQGHYAWAPDLVFPTGLWTDTITDLTFHDDGSKVIGVKGRGAVTEDAATNASDSAWLRTARIRMGTVEDKHWSSITLRGTYGVDAPIGVSLSTPDDGTWDSVFVTSIPSAQRFGVHRNPGEWIGLRFDLAEGAELGSYQLQALPAGNRQRLISLPVSLFDFQQTRSGIDVGYNGWALDRLHDLEALEKSGTEISVSAPALFPDAITCVIERMTYVQTNDPGDQGSGTGGVLQVVLRTTV